LNCLIKNYLILIFIIFVCLVPFTNDYILLYIFNFLFKLLSNF